MPLSAYIIAVSHSNFDGTFRNAEKSNLGTLKRLMRLMIYTPFCSEKLNNISR